MQFYTKKQGFTLAEVLITLAIIGVIASMTIPVLVKNHEKQQIVTRLQKAVSTWNQALQKMSADHGCINDLYCTGIFENTSGLSAGQHTKNVGNEIAKYFNINKNCSNAANQGCFSTAVSNRFDRDVNEWNGDGGTERYRFITADGIAYRFWPTDTCKTNISSGATGQLEQNCGTLQVDIDGPNKGPSNAGKDIFYFYITNGKGPQIYPNGGKDDAGDHWQDDHSPDWCSPDDTVGTVCAARIMEDGWQINYF